jgi:ABC-type multidrug transport system permease subunit
MGAIFAALTHTQSDSGSALGGLKDDGCCQAGFSGGAIPVESQLDWLQTLTFLFPSRHYVSFSQAILYRGAGFTAVWPECALVAGLGLVFCIASLGLFRRSMARST